MMPPPVILLVVLLIGYPLVQILAIRLRRGRRIRFNAAADDLLSDPRVSDHDRNVVRKIVSGSRGGMRTMKIMSRLPKGAFGSAFEQVNASFHQEGKLPEDERIDSLRSQSIRLEMAAHPVASLIVVPLAFAAWSLGAVVALLNGSTRPSLPSFYGFLKAASVVESPAFAGRDR